MNNRRYRDSLLSRSKLAVISGASAGAIGRSATRAPSGSVTIRRRDEVDIAAQRYGDDFVTHLGAGLA